MELKINASEGSLSRWVVWYEGSSRSEWISEVTPCPHPSDFRDAPRQGQQTWTIHQDRDGVVKYVLSLDTESGYWVMWFCPGKRSKAFALACCDWPGQDPAEVGVRLFALVEDFIMGTLCPSCPISKPSRSSKRGRPSRSTTPQLQTLHLTDRNGGSDDDTEEMDHKNPDSDLYSGDDGDLNDYDQYYHDAFPYSANDPVVLEEVIHESDSNRRAVDDDLEELPNWSDNLFRAAEDHE